MIPPCAGSQTFRRRLLRIKDLQIHRRLCGSWKTASWCYQNGGVFLFKIFFLTPWEMIQFDNHTFQMGWNHQLVMYFHYMSSFEYRDKIRHVPSPWRHVPNFVPSLIRTFQSEARSYVTVDLLQPSGARSLEGLEGHFLNCLPAREWFHSCSQDGIQMIRICKRLSPIQDALFFFESQTCSFWSSKWQYMSLLSRFRIPADH